MTNDTVLRAASVLMLVVTLSACRQGQGRVPIPEDEQVNKVGDVSRDLLSTARGASGAIQDLREDMESLGGVVAPPYLIDELATGLHEALAGHAVNDASALRLSNQLFVALTALDLSEAQIATLRNDVAASLQAAGAEQAKAERAAAAVEEIQNATTSNVRRWWQWRSG